MGERGLITDTYTNPDDFLNNLSKYLKDTKIITDYKLNNLFNGFDLAEKLHGLGYTKLYVMSGKDFDKQSVPPYVTVILKDIENLERIV
jgi:hypothetical protein